MVHCNSCDRQVTRLWVDGTGEETIWCCAECHSMTASDDRYTV